MGPQRVMWLLSTIAGHLDSKMVFSKGGGLSMIDVIVVVGMVAAAVTFSSYRRLRDDLAIEAMALNNTPNNNQTAVIFNRNPKAASETVWTLIDMLAPHNKFHSYSDSPEVKKKRGSENTWMPRHEQETYVKMLYHEANITAPFVYIKHMNFIDFSMFNYTTPIYVNLVRDPVDRVISWYYYNRQGWWNVEFDKETNKTSLKRGAMREVRRLKASYEDCLTKKMPECTYPVGQTSHFSPYGGSHFSQISFFCGSEDECDKFGDRNGLKLAMENVEKYFAVVGVVEQMDMSLEVMENYVPRFFKDARQVYARLRKNQKRVTNFNKFKPHVTQWAKDFVRANFSVEYEFYEFCKQRLLRQHLAIK